MSILALKIFGFGGSILLMIAAFGSVFVSNNALVESVNTTTQKQNLTGPTGPPGPRGPPGPAGQDGQDGIDGQNGANGERGAAGSQGAQGIQGPRGNTGLSGSNGANGSPGPTGSTGEQGVRGIQGPVGKPGPIGIPGPVGPTGQRGSIGPTGPPGPVPPIVRGNVNENGTIASGTGFTVMHLSTGRYQVVFTIVFPAPPTMLVTKIYGSPAVDAGVGVEPSENAIVDQITEAAAIVATSNSLGNLADGSFGFQVLGDVPSPTPTP